MSGTRQCLLQDNWSPNEDGLEVIWPQQRVAKRRAETSVASPSAGRRRTGVPHQTSDLRWKYRFSVSSSGRRSQQSRHRSKPVRRLECVATHGQQRGPGSLGAGPSGVTGPWQAHHPRSPLAVLPNPSLKRSANGRPPGPGLRYSVHCLSPGLRCLTPRTAQLER